MTDSIWYVVSYFIGLVNAFAVGLYFWEKKESKLISENIDKLWQLAMRKEGYKSIAIHMDKSSDDDKVWFVKENSKLCNGEITWQELANRAKFHNIKIELEK